VQCAGKHLGLSTRTNNLVRSVRFAHRYGHSYRVQRPKITCAQHMLRYSLPRLSCEKSAQCQPVACAARTGMGTNIACNTPKITCAQHTLRYSLPRLSCEKSAQCQPVACAVRTSIGTVVVCNTPKIMCAQHTLRYLFSRHSHEKFA